MIAATWRDWSAHMAARSRTWARQRQGSDKLRAELHARRVYILPTRAGMVYGAIVFLLLISSMNFSNNMGFALTFWLTGIGLVSMQHCQRNLTRLQLDLMNTQACFAGEHAGFALRLTNPTRASRWQLQVGWDNAAGQAVRLTSASAADLVLQLETHSRGRMHAPRIRISSVFPLGLFRAWAWVHLDAAAIVWPRPAAQATHAPGIGQDAASFSARDHRGDDLAGVRDYQYGDSPRHIDWKALARSGELRVRDYRDGGVSRTWLDWDALDGHDTETRLSMLTRLALDAEADGLTWGLRLPGRTVAPDTGATHLHGCLDLLALHGSAPLPRNGTAQ